MDLIYLFKSLMRKKWLIIFSTILAVVLAFVLTMNQRRLYRSVAQMATGFTTSSQQVKLQDEGFNIFEIDVKFSNLVESIRSPKVLGMLSYAIMIHDLENPGKEYRDLNGDERAKAEALGLNKAKMLEVLKQKYSEEKLLSSYNPEERKILEYMKICRYDLETMRKLMYVDRVQRTDFIDIEYNSGNPELSAYVVNQVIAEFLRSHESSRSQMNIQSIGTLETLMNQKKKELDDKLGNLKSSGSLVDVTAESASKLTQVSNFETKLADEKSSLNAATLGLQEINNKIAEMDRTGAKTATASSGAQQELLNLKIARNNAEAEYKNKGSNDQELYNKWQKLRNDYNAKMASMASSNNIPSTGLVSRADLVQKKSELEIQIKAAQQNIAFYEDKVRQLNSSVNAAATRGATNAALNKEVEFAQTEYENIKKRYEDALNNKVAPLDNYRQILFGQPAVEPEPSKRPIILGLSGMSMFVFMCILIIFLEYIDVSIKTPSQFLRTMNLKMVGVLNKVNLKKSTMENIFTISNPKDRGEAVFREHLRKLRFEIENSSHHVYLFTSARPGEGKSTVIKALAHSISLSKKKVLLIDTNFSNNTLTSEFNAQPMLEGFSNDHKTYTAENIRKIISPTGIEGVDIIGSKGGDYTPSEILGDDNLLAHLDVLRGKYDYIFLEGAALNGRADSMELLRYADSVISVVSARSSLRQTDKESINFLQQLNGKFTGAVLNYVELENIDL